MYFERLSVYFKPIRRHSVSDGVEILKTTLKASLDFQRPD